MLRRCELRAPLPVLRASAALGAYTRRTIGAAENCRGGES
jgi:hypothetical protein